MVVVYVNDDKKAVLSNRLLTGRKPQRLRGWYDAAEGVHISLKCAPSKKKTCLSSPATFVWQCCKRHFLPSISSLCRNINVLKLGINNKYQYSYDNHAKRNTQRRGGRGAGVKRPTCFEFRTSWACN